VPPTEERFFRFLAANLLLCHGVRPIHLSNRPPSASSTADTALDRRLRRLAESEEHPVPVPRPRPNNSAVLSGWICAGIGLLTAWLFPLCHIFFSVALILSIIALATHQVRQGLTLLVCTLVGMTICALVFVTLAAGVAGTLALGAVNHANKGAGPLRQMPLPSSPAARGAITSSSPLQGSTTNRAPSPLPVASKPLAIEEVAMMLRIGLRDEEIIADAAGKQLVSPVGASQAALLRQLGAGEKLLNFLQSRRLYAAPSPAPIGASAPLPQRANVAAAAPEAPVAQGGMSPEEKVRRIANLTAQVNDLDEQVRSIRVNPRGNAAWWRYSRSGGSGVDQAALDRYLKELDARRNNLRREKWRLEGR
jgi:hypothetical protein